MLYIRRCTSDFRWRSDLSKHAISLLFAVLLGSISQLVLKSAFVASTDDTVHEGGSTVVNQLFAAIDMIQNFLSPLLGEVQFVLLVAGLFSYILSMVFWLLALQRFDLGKAYACLGLSYVLVYIGSVLWPTLAESVTWAKSIGVCLVFFGVTLITAETTPRFLTSATSRKGARQ